jgi:hypothetical protein
MEKEKRFGYDRRHNLDRRAVKDPKYKGPERRSGVDRRVNKDRRSTLHHQSRRLKQVKDWLKELSRRI